VLPRYRADPRPGLLLTGDIQTMKRLAEATGDIRAVNLGGIHHRPGRVQRMRYIFLSPDEERELREMAARGLAISAQDVPAARPVPLEDVLNGKGGDRL
jgi:PTS system mannose-specific IIB component/fructoselysine and glucoselysine-specific PTS system IIB component